jgi:hypothetical protein
MSKKIPHHHCHYSHETHICMSNIFHSFYRPDPVFNDSCNTNLWSQCLSPSRDLFQKQVFIIITIIRGGNHLICIGNVILKDRVMQGWIFGLLTYFDFTVEIV